MLPPLWLGHSEKTISQARGSLLSTRHSGDILIVSLIRTHLRRSRSAPQGFVSERFREPVRQEVSGLRGRQ